MLAAVVIVVFTEINLKLILLSMVSYNLIIFARRIKLTAVIVMLHVARAAKHRY